MHSAQGGCMWARNAFWVFVVAALCLSACAPQQTIVGQALMAEPTAGALAIPYIWEE